MAGLLDFISTPEGQGLLSAAFGGLAGARRGTPLNNLGRAGLAGLGGYVDAQDRVTQQDERAKMNQMRDLQLKQMQQQQAAAELARTQEAEFRNTIPSPQESMIQGTLGGNRAPTMANAQQLTPVDPRQQLMFQAMRLGQMKPSEYLTATAKDDTPTILPEGANLVGGRASNFKVLASGAPKAGKESSLAQLLTERDSLPPGDPRMAFYNDAIKKATTNAPAASLSVTLPPQENEYRKGQGKEFSEFMGTLNKAGFSAPAQIRKLERMEQLLAGVDGGKLSPTGLDIASAMASLGIKVDPKLGNKEASQALAREIAGSFRQPGTGPMTDKDFENFLLQVPDLSKTAAGRQQITKTMKAALARDIALGKKAREYEKRNGQLDSGFMDEAAQFIAENPVIGLPEGWKVR